MSSAYDVERGKALSEQLAARRREAQPNNRRPHNPDDAQIPDVAVDGAQFILDQPSRIPAIWGSDTRVLWAEGEALMIAGPQGVGKTTLAGMLVRAALGLGSDVLGLPVADLGCRIAYFAMDRPRQISRSLKRQFAERDRDVLAERLIVRPGPPPADLAAQPTLLVGMAENYDAGIVFVDSLKDAAVGLSEDEVGASYNRARQHLLGSGRQIVEVHHVVKRGQQHAVAPTTIDQIYGSTWLTSGCGSVVLLGGEPGDPIVSFRHVKQPAEEVGPWRLVHDAGAGVLTIEHGVDLVALVTASGPDGLTAKGAAATIFEKPNPSRADVEKARRKLDQLAGDGILTRLDGDRGGGDVRQTTAWFLADRTQSRAITEINKPAGQSNHALFDAESNQKPITAITPNQKPQVGQSRSNHANHARSNHETTTPL